MILLEIINRAVHEALQIRFESILAGNKPETTELKIADFDGVIYHISNLNQDKSKLLLSVRLSFYQELNKYGANQLLKREYGDHLLDTPENGYSASLVFNLESIGDNWKELIEKASKIKRNCFAAVFETYFDYQARGETGNQTAVINYRKDEKLFVRAQSDRVTVIFSTVFASEDDLVIGRVFMMAFANGRMRYSEAPQVLFNEINPPAEISEISGLAPDSRRAYLTFVLAPRHTSPQNRNNTIDLISMLRNYLHYHLKCSKAYIHQRMRDKTNDFLKVLNRAKPEKQKDDMIKKTISGKTMRQQ